jgi:hypothetical protein
VRLTLLIALYALLIVVGWWLLAYAEMGQP